MDNTPRRNSVCIIGQPSCDYVFSSTPNCFIGFGFGESDLEVGLLESVLRERNIEPVRADTSMASGQHAFCVKICSKIITSRFCAIFVNSNSADDKPAVNGNVYMEYGLMLGFNKCVIPFQRESDKLPFNIAGLDTIKYTSANFLDKARTAVDTAIRSTESPNQTDYWTALLDHFLMERGYVFSSLREDGEGFLFDRAKPLGFSLCNDLVNSHYMYFAIFPNLATSVIKWKLEKLLLTIRGLDNVIAMRAISGTVNEKQLELATEIIKKFRVLIAVEESQVTELSEWILEMRQEVDVEILAHHEITDEVQSIFN